MTKLEVTRQLIQQLGLENPTAHALDTYYKVLWVDHRLDGSMLLTSEGYKLLASANMFKFYEFQLPKQAGSMDLIQLARRCSSPYIFLKGKLLLSDEKLATAAALYPTVEEFLKNLPKRY